MCPILRATDRNQGIHPVAFNFDDLAGQADRYLSTVRAEAAKILGKAQEDANAIRASAEREGRQAAMAAVERTVAKQLEPILPGLRQVVRDIQHAKQAWLTHWEAAAVHVAAAAEEDREG